MIFYEQNRTKPNYSTLLEPSQRSESETGWVRLICHKLTIGEVESLSCSKSQSASESSSMLLITGSMPRLPNAIIPSELAKILPF